MRSGGERCRLEVQLLAEVEFLKRQPLQNRPTAISLQPAQAGFAVVAAISNRRTIIFLSACAACVDLRPIFIFRGE